jgi:hypothetical protein
MALHIKTKPEAHLTPQPRAYLPGSEQPFFDEKVAQCRDTINRVGLPTNLNLSETATPVLPNK